MATDAKDGNRLDFDEKLRCALLVLVWFLYAALSILLIIALLTDWPEILHRYGTQLGR